MKRVAVIALCLLLALPCAAWGASGKGGVSVTPLEDEFAGQSAPLYTPPGPKGTAGERAADSGAASGTGQNAASGNLGENPREASPGALPARGASVSGPGSGSEKSGKDAVVIAYLIDLARKRNKPCPSGAAFPVPPSLIFSEPLCKAAQAARNGADPLAAITEQGIRAAKWRMFNAKDAPAQRVVNGLHEKHCEALLEPYTHIGAYRDAAGWSILLATLAEDPAGGESVPPSGSGSGNSGGNNGAGAGSASPAKEAGITAAERALPGEAAALAVLAGGGETAPAMPRGAASTASPAAAPGSAPAAGSVMPGQEARALFMLLNELRAKGGTCFGKAMPPVPALAFSPELQAAAEKDIRAGYGATARPSGVREAAVLYRGSNVTKLALKANSHASVTLDVWMVSPSQCEALLSPMFTDAGAAYEDGSWVLILGGMNEGVPSDK